MLSTLAIGHLAFAAPPNVLFILTDDQRGDALGLAGYDTAYIGKWHMGEDNDEPRPGFNWFVTHKGQGKYFDTEFNINGLRHETPKGYYTHVVTDKMPIDEGIKKELPDQKIR